MSYFTKSKFVKELTPKDFDPTKPWLPREKKCGAILFYADWCPHCSAMKESWEQLGKSATFFNIMAFNCADPKNKTHMEKIYARKPDLIKGYPTIMMTSGSELVLYQGDRTLDKILKSCMDYCSGDE
jgi:thiol-disulfide isomerase/thioredoxin